MKSIHANTVLFMLIILSSCIQKPKSTHQEIDYSNAINWLSLPQQTIHNVDVFYVYPTIYAEQDPPNMDIYDSTLRNHAKGLLTAQAGVYSEYANLYAPFYRQQSAASQSMKAGNGGKDAYQDPAFKIGAGDVEKAFDYYMKHLNNKRPFILAGHSQGTMALINLMRKKFNNTMLQEQLIAAYLIGYSITDDDLKNYPWLKLAKAREDIGVIISYNSEGSDAGPSPVLFPGAHVINPLNWKTDTTKASNEEHLGARFYKDASGKLIEEIPQFCSAQIDLEKGVLLISQMKEPQSDQIDFVNMGRWSKGVYHRFDYAFFYNNLKQNTKDRIQSYWKQHPSME